MYLKQLIAILESEDPNLRVPRGFGKPHSYRGYYEQLAFEPMENVTVGEMLNAAKSALHATYSGYKGGEYNMTGYTECWLSKYGTTGEMLGESLLKFLLDAGRTRDALIQVEMEKRIAAETRASKAEQKVRQAWWLIKSEFKQRDDVQKFLDENKEPGF